MANKRLDPNFEQISGVVPKEVSRRFRQIIAAKGLKISDGLAEALQDYVDRNEPELFAASSGKPQTIAEFVQQHYFVLTRSSKLTPEKLNVIAEGEEPTKDELYIISSLTKVPQRELVELHKKTYGSMPLSNGDGK
ncbi:MAG TPA: hypothetical protein V6D33_03410 [Cyanophyceae cyanobacterium]